MRSRPAYAARLSVAKEPNTQLASPQGTSTMVRTPLARMTFLRKATERSVSRPTSEPEPESEARCGLRE